MFELLLLKWISDKIDTVFVTTISHIHVCCVAYTKKNHLLTWKILQQIYRIFTSVLSHFQLVNVLALFEIDLVKLMLNYLYFG